MLLRRLFAEWVKAFFRRCLRWQYYQSLVSDKYCFIASRNLEDFVSDKVTNTLDKPKPGFQVQAEKMFGGVDIKINSQGNRLAVSSIDYGMSIYNIDAEKGLTHYRDTQREQFDASKVEFTPSGNEILSGSLSLKIFDIT